MRHILYLLPVLVFVVLVGFFATRLELIGQGNAPSMIPSVMINKPAPPINLPYLLTPSSQLTTSNLSNKVVLINFFSSWCLPCRAEHPILSGLKNTGITLVGLNYKDRPQDVNAWLAKMGNPYDIIAVDQDGRTAIDFGVYGVPESYLIDKKGIIRYKQIGPLTEDDLRNHILPLAKKLEQ